MNTRRYARSALVGAYLVAGSIAFGQEESVPLSAVPAAVIEAAQAAVQGLQVSSAEMETEGGQIVYELEGTAAGVDYEIEVTADGQVLEVETDD